MPIGDETMRDDVKGVSEKAKRDIEKSTAVKKRDSFPWTEIMWRVGGMLAMTVAAVINYPEVSPFERMQYVMIWMIWAELFIVNTRRR